MNNAEVIVALIGCALIIVGTAMFSIPISLIVAGMMCVIVAFASLMERGDEEEE